MPDKPRPCPKCSRCGASSTRTNTDVYVPPRTEKMKTVTGGPPAWFYRSSGVQLPAPQPGIIALNPQEPSHRACQLPPLRKNCKADWDLEDEDGLHKVHAWLKRCYKLPCPPPAFKVLQLATDYGQSGHPGLIPTPKDHLRHRRHSQPGRKPMTVRGKAPLAGSWPDDMQGVRERILRRQGDQFHGRNDRFSQALTPNDSVQLRSQMGPIARPHTPRDSLSQNQKARFGTNALYGYRGPKSTVCQDLDTVRGRTYRLHETAKGVLKK